MKDAQNASQKLSETARNEKRTTPAKGIATVDVSLPVDRDESADLPGGRIEDASEARDTSDCE